jgi:polar amino acid transport system substrate-binding protein
MKFKFTRVIALLVSVILTVGLAACGKKDTASTNAQESSKTASETKLDKIKKAGKIVLGTSPDYPPYEFIREVDGKSTVVGFDIEIAKEIAKDLGVQLEIKEMDFGGLLTALSAGKIDMVLAGMTPKPERLESADFSNIYYTAVQTLVIKAEDAGKYKAAEDLSGKVVGVQKGSIQVDVAAEQLPKAEAKQLSKITDIVMSLKTGKVQAAIIEGPVAKSYVNANKDLAISEVKLNAPDAGSAVAVDKGNKELIAEINKTLDRLTKAGTIDKLVTEATNSVVAE